MPPFFFSFLLIKFFFMTCQQLIWQITLFHLSFCQSLQSFMVFLVGVLLGRIAQDAASSNGGFDVSTYFQSTIIYVGVIAIIGVNLSLYGRDFFEVWLGAEVNRQMMQVYYILVVSFVLNFIWLVRLQYFTC